jgi:plasmid stabilization system protein ParE
MSLPVVYLPAARDDIDRARLQYEEQRSGLGERFVSAVESQVNRIHKNPGSWGIVYQDIRAAALRRFPYVIYYRVEPDRNVVIAVQHGSRDWSSWQSRA